MIRIFSGQQPQEVRTVSNDDSFDYIMADLAKRQKELEF